MQKLLIIILIVAAILRLSWLGSVPSGYFRDEAAISYNAYSIWKTGADEFGVKLPLVFRSFEVFFLPLYIYITAPIVGILGPTIFASRLLSALSGILAIYFIFLIGKKIWGEKVGLISSFILAISPWHIFYSRATFEGNLALTLFVGGFYFWLIFREKYLPKYFLISLLLFSFSMYSYQAERLVVPLFGMIALIVDFQKIWSIKNTLLIPLIICFLVMVPLLSLSFKPGGYHRALGVSIFSQEKNPTGFSTSDRPNFFSNNKTFLLVKEISSLYFSYYSPRNLFIEGDYNRQRSVVGFSVFFSFMFIGLVYGVFKFFSSFDTNKKLLFTWILLAPIPAALTGDPFHTYRSLLLYAPLSILIGFGFAELLKRRISYWLLFLIVSCFSLGAFLYNYVYLNSTKAAHDWDYGYSEMVQYIGGLPKDTRVIVDDPWTEAYIHFLYFGKVDPKSYQAEVLKLGDPTGYYYTNSAQIRPEKVGNIEFRKVDWPSERGDKGTIFVIWAESLPDSEFTTDPKVKLLKQIMYPVGKVAFKIVKVI